MEAPKVVAFSSNSKHFFFAMLNFADSLLGFPNHGSATASSWLAFAVVGFCFEAAAGAVRNSLFDLKAQVNASGCVAEMSLL